MDHSQDPCAWVIFENVGIGYCKRGIGAVSRGSLIHQLESVALALSPLSEYSLQAIWGFSQPCSRLPRAINCAMKGVRKKVDPYNAVGVICTFFV